MTLALAAENVAAKLAEKFAKSIIECRQDSLLVKAESLLGIISYLKSEPGLALDYLTGITAVDYWDYFELVYQLTSIAHNHSLVVKARLPGRENLSVSSIVKLYQGADYQEREIFDLMGIRFEGHPNLKHIVLWEGFQGYPLRKDYL